MNAWGPGALPQHSWLLVSFVKAFAATIYPINTLEYFWMQ